ncbi:MAG: hypothetical protein Q9187_004006, partial [Circinaria calcarea]
MSPPVASAKLTLSCPLYAADFDPQNNGFLIVGGGGGEGRSGVGNKISLINTSRKHELSEVVEINLSRDEDSVTSLAIAKSSDISASVFAGINSSTAEQQAGRNEHLRSFRINYPPKRDRGTEGLKTLEGEAIESAPATQALGRVALFTPSSAAKKETYQRVLRLSSLIKDGNPRLGVIATGLAPAGEIVVFNAERDTPDQKDVRGRIQLAKGQEASDVDIIDTENEVYRVAYCTDYEVYLYDIPANSQETSREPRFLHETPFPDVFAASKGRPKFRSLRFLNPTLILLVQNQMNRTGVELLLLDISQTPSLANVILRKRLHKGIKSATSLSTAVLSPPTPTQNTQHVIAVAGQDISLTVLSLEHPPSRSASANLKFRTHILLRNVHPLQMSALAFSKFILPSVPTLAPPQYFKLASTSIGNTVVVHTFPLRPYPPSSKTQKSVTRYVLTLPSAGETAQMGFSVLVSVIVVAIFAFLMQAFIEIRGGTPEYLGAKSWLTQRVHDYIALPYMFENITVAAPVIPSQMPSVEDVKRKVPSLENVQEVLQDVKPKLEELQDQIHNPEEIKDTLQDSAQSIRDSIPSTEQIKHTFSLRSLLSHRLNPNTEDTVPGLPDEKSIM